MLRKITLSVLIIIAVLFGAAFTIGLPSAAVPKSSTVYDINGRWCRDYPSKIKVRWRSIRCRLLCEQDNSYRGQEFLPPSRGRHQRDGESHLTNIKAGKIVAEAAL